MVFKVCARPGGFTAEGHDSLPGNRHKAADQGIAIPGKFFNKLELVGASYFVVRGQFAVNGGDRDAGRTGTARVGGSDGARREW